MTVPTNFRFQLVRWTIFLILILTYILVYFHRMAPGVVSEDLMASFHTTGTALGTLAAIYFFVYAAMQIPSGVMADTLGTRTAVIAGNLTAGAGSILFGLAGSFEMACMGRFFVGLGVSVVFVGIMKNNSVWFSERVFGFMSGLTLFVGNMGSVFAAGPLAAILTVFEWRRVFLGIGILSLTLAGAGFLIVRNRPEDAGFPSIQAMAGKTPPAARKAHWFTSLMSIIKVRRIWPGFWVQLGITGGLYAFMGLWAIPYLRDVFGLARQEAAQYMTVMLLSFAVGSLFFGWISDRMGKRKPVLVSGVVVYAVTWMILMYAPWSPGPTGFILLGLMGFTGASFVLTFASAKEVINPALSGMAVSVVNTGAFMGTALMQPLFGWIADITWSGTTSQGVRVYAPGDYHNGFLAMLVFALIGVAGALCIRETHCRNISTD